MSAILWALAMTIQDVSFEERLLGTVPDDVSPAQVFVSPDGRAFALFASHSNRTYEVYAGEKSVGIYNCIGRPIVFLADKRTIAYSANLGGVWSEPHEFKGGKWFMVEGDRRHEPFDFVSPPVLSPDRKTLIYEASIGGVADEFYCEGGKRLYVIDGKRGDEYDGVRGIVFSSNSRWNAYAANLGGALDDKGRLTGGRWHIVRNGERGAAFEWVSSPTLKNDGTAVYGATKDGKAFLVIGDETQAVSEDWVGEIVFSPDERSMALVAHRDGKMRVIRDGKEGPEFDWAGDLSFSGNGTVLGYRAKKSDRHAVVIGDKVYDLDQDVPYGAPAIGQTEPVVRFAVLVRGDRRSYIFENGTKSPWFFNVGNPVFSPDGREVAFWGSTMIELSVIIGNQAQVLAPHLHDDPVWSPSGSKVAFASWRNPGEIWWNVIDLNP